MIPRSELTAAQREIGRVKDHALHIESDLAKERAEAARVKEKLAQAQEEIRREKLSPAMRANRVRVRAIKRVPWHNTTGTRECVPRADCIPNMLGLWCSIRHEKKPVNRMRSTGFCIVLEAGIAGMIEANTQRL